MGWQVNFWSSPPQASVWVFALDGVWSAVPLLSAGWEESPVVEALPALTAGWARPCSTNEKGGRRAASVS